VPIYRGDGGSGDATTDAYASEIALYAKEAEEQANIATNKANEASASASQAATSAANAASSATDAASSASDAASSASDAASSASDAEDLFDEFDERYLGAKASDPATNNQGGPLTAGAVYFNTTTDTLKIYDGTSWQAQTGSGTVTSVSGVGAVNGITLTGTVTTDGDLTLGGSLSGITASQLNSQNISQWTNDSGYITGNETITLTGAITGSGTTSIATTLSTIDGGSY
jgi:hypothetical protein